MTENAAPKTQKKRHTVLRGRVQLLWSLHNSRFWTSGRFALDETPVSVRSPFLVPPEITDGDELVVAGVWGRDVFHAMAIARPAEPAEETERRRRRERFGGVSGLASLLARSF